MRTIYLVLRCAEDGQEPPVAQMAFDTEELAHTHCADATTRLGVPHLVQPLTLSSEAPELTVWHSLVIELDLTGAELWRHESQALSFEGYHDARIGPTCSSRVLVRASPSQPPSRVRIEATGVDSSWCSDAAWSAWQEAQAGQEFADAVVIEEMFSTDLLP